MTARALITKGVDPQTAIAAVQPGNTDYSRRFWNQAFTQGAHTQETDKDATFWDAIGNRSEDHRARRERRQIPALHDQEFRRQRNAHVFNTKTFEDNPWRRLRCAGGVLVSVRYSHQA